jgi:hypothetical protein
MSELRERGHRSGHDYAKGSPHLRHYKVRELAVSSVHTAVAGVMDRNGACRALELGAGHGTFSDHLVAAGAEVEVTEMSAPSVEVLRRRFRHNPRVTVTHDLDGGAALRDGPLGAAVCISVFHHIPGYLATVRRLVERIVPGGAFLCMQDLLWYPRRSHVDRNAYLLWRLGWGEFRRGIATRARRMCACTTRRTRRIWSSNHVVRQGVGEEALRMLLEPEFREVEFRHYWSTQSGLPHGIGEVFFPPITFGILARNSR